MTSLTITAVQLCVCHHDVIYWLYHFLGCFLTNYIISVIQPPIYLSLSVCHADVKWVHLSTIHRPDGSDYFNGGVRVFIRAQHFTIVIHADQGFLQFRIWYVNESRYFVYLFQMILLSFYNVLVHTSWTMIGCFPKCTSILESRPQMY